MGDFSAPLRGRISTSLGTMILVVTQLTKNANSGIVLLRQGCLIAYIICILRQSYVYIYTYVDAFGNDYTHIHTYMDVEWNGR